MSSLPRVAKAGWNICKWSSNTQVLLDADITTGMAWS